MNGRELEQLLSSIDENIAFGRASLRREILDYMEAHEAYVLNRLSSDEQAVDVPTSVGDVRVTVNQLQELAGSAI